MRSSIAIPGLVVFGLFLPVFFSIYFRDKGVNDHSEHFRPRRNALAPQTRQTDCRLHDAGSPRPGQS